MAEFKFPCPQCQQHILCDVAFAGMQINCPGCQNVIAVPQPPLAAPVAPVAAIPPSPPPTAAPPTTATPPPARASAGAPKVVEGMPSKRGSSMILKVALGCFAAIFVLGTAAGVYWWMSRPQVMKFSDDATVTLLGADYGTRHTVPGGKLPKVTARPAAAGRGAAPAIRPAGNGSFTTPNPALVVWVRAKYEYVQNQYHNFQFYVYDAANTACATAYTTRTVSGNQRGDDILAIQFDTFPRREGKFVVRAQENYSGGQEMSEDKFTINNPAAGKTFQKWSAEPMPNKQTDGDLAMTLTKLLAGADMPYQRNGDNPDDAINKGVKVAFHLERNGKPVSSWAPVGVETSDGTGNRTTINYGNNGTQVQWNNDEGTFTYQYGLWPAEPAWKLRMEFTQTSDFSSEDQWTVTNIPVVLGSQQIFNGMTGPRGGMSGRGGGPAAAVPAIPAPASATTPFAEADMGGHHIKVFPAMLFTNLLARPVNLPANVNFSQPQQTGFMIQVQPALMNNGMRGGMMVNGTQPTDDGMRLSLAKITDPQGGELQNYSSGWSSSGAMGTPDSVSTFRFTLRDTGDVTNINATISMHKNHFFEFTVKPDKAAAE